MKLKNAVLIGILAAAAVSTAGCGKKEAVPSDTAAQTEAAKQTDAGQTEAQGNSEEERKFIKQYVL